MFGCGNEIGSTVVVRGFGPMPRMSSAHTLNEDQMADRYIFLSFVKYAPSRIWRHSLIGVVTIWCMNL